MKKLFLLSIILLATVFGFIKSQEFEEPIKANNSIEKVLAMGDSANGRHVTVEGYLHWKFEGNSIWLSKRAYDRDDLNMALALDMEPTNPDYKRISFYDGKMVSLKGFFSTEIKGHGGFCRGGLSNISNVTLLK